MRSGSSSLFVYIVASPSRTIYIGITNDLRRRVEEHKVKAHPGFTATYNVHRLVWFEEFADAAHGYLTRKAIEELATCEEDQADRVDEPSLE